MCMRTSRCVAKVIREITDDLCRSGAIPAVNGIVGRTRASIGNASRDSWESLYRQWSKHIKEHVFGQHETTQYPWYPGECTVDVSETGSLLDVCGAPCTVQYQNDVGADQFATMMTGINP